MKDLAFNFFIGVTVTTLIVELEKSGYRSLSAFATLIPVFTLVSYIFIGQSSGGLAVSTHSKFVLVGTLLSWVPYMLVIAFLAPRIGSNKAIAAGFAVFFVLAAAFVGMVEQNKLFQ
ncbi:MAG: hypothetical protein ACXWQE_02250 [Bdellovibrionales bacterium]